MHRLWNLELIAIVVQASRLTFGGRQYACNKMTPSETVILNEMPA
jgi:hypothetical protein